MADRVHICTSCEGGAELARRLEGRLGAAEIRPAPCLNVCGAPATLAFRAEGKAAWLFSGVTPEMADDVAAFAALYAAAPGGAIADARGAGALRFRLRGMIPA